MRLIVGLQLMQTHSGVLSPSIVTDMATYQRYAADILSGRFPSEFYYQPFYYSVFLPLVQILTGPSAVAVIIAQALCGAVSVWLAWLIARRIGAGRFGAGAAAVLLTFSSMAIIYIPFTLLETLQAFLLALTLYLTLRAMTRKTIISWGLVGVSLACAILTRGNALLLFPAILLGFFLAQKKLSRKQKALSLTVMIAAMLLVQAPFSIVNTIAHKSFQGPSTAGGNVLALGNTPEAPPGWLVYPRSYNLWMRSEVDRSVVLRMFDWMCQEPLAFFEHQFLKCLQFWDHQEIPNNISPLEAVRKSDLLTSLGGGIPSGWIFSLALAGILLSIPRLFKGKYLLLTAVLYIVLYCPAVAVFYNLARFRVPGLPIFCAAAGLFFQSVHTAFRKKGEAKRKAVVMIAGAAFLSVFIVYFGTDWYMNQAQPLLMRVARPHGVDVPNGQGGRLIYDHTQQCGGGWFPVNIDLISKRINPRTPIKPGTPVSIKIFSAGPSYFILNGKVCDMRHLRDGYLAQVTIQTVYPKDNIFRFESGGNAIFLADRHRDYNRSLDRDGQSIGGELIMELETR